MDPVRANVQPLERAAPSRLERVGKCNATLVLGLGQSTRPNPGVGGWVGSEEREATEDWGQRRHQRTDASMLPSKQQLNERGGCPRDDAKVDGRERRSGGGGVGGIGGVGGDCWVVVGGGCWVVVGGGLAEPRDCSLPCCRRCRGAQPWKTGCKMHADRR